MLLLETIRYTFASRQVTKWMALRAWNCAMTHFIEQMIMMKEITSGSSVYYRNIHDLMEGFEEDFVRLKPGFPERRTACQIQTVISGAHNNISCQETSLMEDLPYNRTKYPAFEIIIRLRSQNTEK
jgi:hypothetical protein